MKNISKAEIKLPESKHRGGYTDAEIKEILKEHNILEDIFYEGSAMRYREVAFDEDAKEILTYKHDIQKRIKYIKQCTGGQRD